MSIVRSRVTNSWREKKLLQDYKLLPLIFTSVSEKTILYPVVYLLEMLISKRYPLWGEIQNAVSVEISVCMNVKNNEYISQRVLGKVSKKLQISFWNFTWAAKLTVDYFYLMQRPSMPIVTKFLGIHHLTSEKSWLSEKFWCDL